MSQLEPGAESLPSAPLPATEDPLLGRLLEGRYRILSKVGEGGLGLVYRAEHLKLGRSVAVKFLKEELVEHAHLRPRFELEARALAQLSHPNIVGVHDYGLCDGSPYLVMEMLEGRTLRELLNTGALSELQAHALMVQLLQGLAYAHAQGVIHRDLKPTNLFLQRFATQPDQLKILDFGFAKFANDGGRSHLSRTSPVLGTPAYLPPEQALGDAVDARTDVYAAGILLFEMLTGAQPFRGDVPDILRQQLRAPLPAFAQVCRGTTPSAALVELLERATHKDRNERFVDGAAFLTAFQSLARPLVRFDGNGPLPHPPPSIGVSGEPTVVVHEPTHVLTIGSPLAVVADRLRGRALTAFDRLRVHGTVAVGRIRRQADALLAVARSWAQQVKRSIHGLWLAARHPATPWYAKLWTLLVIAYALSPIDLIPDFIPVVGLLDDLLLVPLGLIIAVRLMPADVWQECTAQLEARQATDSASKSLEPPRPSRIGAVLVIGTWLAALGLVWAWL